MSYSPKVNKVFCEYNINQIQSYPALSENIINYNNKVIDTHNAVTTGSSWKFTAPVNGTYIIIASLRCVSSVPPGYMAVHKCNASGQDIWSYQIGYNNSNPSVLSGTLTFIMNKGESFYCTEHSTCSTDKYHSGYNYIQITQID